MLVVRFSKVVEDYWKYGSDSISMAKYGSNDANLNPIDCFQDNYPAPSSLLDSPGKDGNIDSALEARPFETDQWSFEIDKETDPF